VTDVSRQTYPFTLPDLPYAYDALEPYVDQLTLQIHHREHHASYVKKLNAALAKEPELQRHTLAQLLRDVHKLPEAVRTAVRNNGGGHLNHALFWNSLAPALVRTPPGALGAAIDLQFGSFEQLRKKFSDAAAQHFASGWVALAFHHATKQLEIVGLKDHEVLSSAERTGLIIIDVWEHAYYLKYQNRRGDFIDAFWSIVNWPRAAEAFSTATQM